MKVAKYWARESATARDAKGYEYRLVSWWGSSQGVQHAKAGALQKLNRWKELLSRGQPLGDYPYGDGDQIKEELIELVYAGKGETVAAITRNRYGALVLNSANVLFADIDLPTPPRRAAGAFAKWFAWFRNDKARQQKEHNERAVCRHRLAEFQQRNSDITLRVYETFAGFRVAVTNKLFQPLDDTVKQLLQQMNSDELYIKLCRSQECFRARLTPKPWRCEFKGPPNEFPRENDGDRDRFADWLTQYQEKSLNFGVCRLVEQLGQAECPETVDIVLQLHDAYVLKDDQLHLA